MHGPCGCFCFFGSLFYGIACVAFFSLLRYYIMLHGFFLSLLYDTLVTLLIPVGFCASGGCSICMICNA